MTGRSSWAAAGASAPYNDLPKFTLSGAPKDSLQKFKGWYEPLGHETVQFQESDFFDLSPDRPVLIGKSRVSLLVPTLGENVVRFNRVEGIYIGIPLTYIPGDKRKNTYLHTNVGIATWTGAFKYDASAGWDNGCHEDRGRRRAFPHGHQQVQDTVRQLCAWRTAVA